MDKISLQILDTLFSGNSFPLEECTVPDKKFLKLFNGTNDYVCLIADKRFPEQRSIKVMKPYIWVEDDNDVSLAWNDKDDNWVDNCESPIHGYGYSDEFVIGWIPYSKESDDDYLKGLVERLKV